VFDFATKIGQKTTNLCLHQYKTNRFSFKK